MNRLGWAIAAAILLAVAALVALQGRVDAGPAAPGTVSGAPVESLAVPVAGVRRSALTDTWNQSREGGARVHRAIDIPAPGGTSVVAAMPGTVEKLFVSERGGITVYVRSVGGDWLAYYAHLAGYAPGLHEGQTVRAGQGIGYVGDTGNAGSGNTHLHFALHRMAPGDRWYQGTPVDPYPLLARSGPAR